jgi:threonine/homoserine/homoserine lactone efflux protein
MASARKIGRSVMGQAFLVQATNPKTLLFFTAVLPPFLDLARPLTPQLVMYAPATLGLDVTAMSIYGLGGAAFARRMQERGFRRGFGLATAALLGAAAALLGSAALHG